VLVENGRILSVGFATSAAADLLGLGREIGTLEKGKQADLLAVAGDPAVSIGLLKEVRLVVQAGRIVRRSERHDRPVSTPPSIPPKALISAPIFP
jgi:cytosine/adenosine deaminase-related metal-dependent hydrolase